MTRLLAILLIWISSAALLAQGPADVAKAESAITLEDYKAHLLTISSDEFGGREPSTPGEEKTVTYLRDQFAALGLKPGNGDSWFQDVPLVAITTTPEKRMEVQGVARGFSMPFGTHWVAASRRLEPEVRIENSELVFAGYGAVAPEYDWNDFEGLDLKGKTVLVLVNDPGFATQDSTLFTGNAMTYYGRWTYKFEEAARQGAAGVLVIHETEAAGYPWGVIGGDRISANYYLEAKDGNKSRCALEGWISEEAARNLMAYAGVDYDAQKEAAARPGYRAQPLGVTYSMTLKNEIHRSTSRNVLALLPGSDLKDEYIIFSAHWDHFGIREDLEGDNIFNGARDNGTGTAALLSMARAFSSLPNGTRRSILFMPVTAEEQGLLGSAYYASHPVYPTNQTVAVINMDAMNIFGPMKDITIVGKGLSELDEYVLAAAKEQGRYVRPDPEPQKGVFYRSDHFSFAKQGIPALYARMGVDHVEKGEAWTRRISAKWTIENYHKVNDEYDPAMWDLRGTIDDIRLLFRIGFRLAQSDAFPNWYPGNEFRARRDADMARKSGE